MYSSKTCLQQTVWPDLEIYRHFGKILKAFGYSLRVYFALGKILNLFGRQIFKILDKFSVLLMAQKDNLGIWSHCLPKGERRNV